MNKLSLKVSAKINLYLNVLAKRKDGYHEIESVIQSISLYDQLIFRPLKSGEIKILCSHPRVPLGPNNLSHQAAKLFLEVTGIKTGVEIRIQKNIPIRAGLGGGSANGAATLFGLNKLFQTNIPQAHLLEWASQLGADVPFFLIGGTALVRGKGERIHPLPSIKGGWLVLFYPAIPISTSWAYSLIQPGLTKRTLDDRLLEKKIFQQGLAGMKTFLYNALEKVIIERFPDLEKTKFWMRERGAEGVLMSGSGSSIFGLVRNRSVGKLIFEDLKKKGQTYLIQPVEKSIKEE